MLVEVLGVAERKRASRTLSSSVAAGPGVALVVACAGLLPAIGRSLFHTMHGCQMALEHIRSVEALFCRRSSPRAESAHHGAFVVGKGVAVLVIFTSESFCMVFTSDDGTLLRTLGLVRKHMSLQILENATAFGVRASTLLLVLIIVANAARGGAIPRTPGVGRRHRESSLIHRRVLDS